MLGHDFVQNRVDVGEDAEDIRRRVVQVGDLELIDLSLLSRSHLTTGFHNRVHVTCKLIEC